jgi:WD40 repeat protein
MAHRSPITCVDQFLGAEPQEDVLVTGGYDGQVVAWDFAGNELWHTDFADLVNDVRVDPTGTQVAVAVADRHTFVLDARTGAYTDVLGPHGDDVNAVRWSPDGQRIVCVMDHLDMAVRVWEAHDGIWSERALVGHESGVFAAAFDSSGSRLVTVAEDSTARIWNLTTGETIHVLNHPGDPEAVDWSPVANRIVSGCDDGVARVWDAESGKLVRELTDASAAVRFVRFEANGARCLVGSYDATMRVYDCTTWEVVHQFVGAFQWERAACFTRAGIVMGSFSAEPLGQPALHQRRLRLTFGINSVAATHGRLFVGRDDGAVVDVLLGRVVASHDTIVNSVVISPSGSVIASADYRGGLQFTAIDAGSHSTESTSAIAALSVRADGGGPINSIAWHPDGEHLYTGGYDGAVRRWTAGGECTMTWTAHHGPIKSLAWSTSADLLVAGSSDGSLSGWRDGVEQWRSTTDDLVLVNAVAVADEEGVVVTASRDLHVRRWDARTGALLETFPTGHLKSVKAIAVSPDGNVILTGSYDGTGIIWTRTSGVTSRWSWRPVRHHGKPGVPTVALANGNAITGGWDGTVARWSLDGTHVATYEANLIHRRV